MTSLADGDIRLEPLVAEHAAAMDALARDDDVARFTRVPEPVPEGFGERWVERYTRGATRERTRPSQSSTPRAASSASSAW